MSFSKFPYRLIAIVLLFSMIITPTPPAEAQGPEGSQFQFTGTVEDVDGSLVIVSGLQVDISFITITSADLEIGMTVTVVGVMDETIVVAAVVIIIAAPPQDVPSDGSAPPDSPPSDTPPDDTDSTDNGPVIIIEGPVQSININIIMIFNIEVEVDPADPVLIDLHIGDYVRIAGETHIQGGTIIILAVTVVIINIEIHVDGGWLPGNCKRTKKGKITCKRSKRT